MPITIHVANLRNTQAGEYIGRRQQIHRRKDVQAGSPLANPYHFTREEDRNHVINQYRVWLWRKIQASDVEVLQELRRLLTLARRPEGVTLLCWCAPKPCHGIIIARALQWMEEQERK